MRVTLAWVSIEVAHGCSMSAQGCGCAGAKHEEDDVLLLRVHWQDGYHTWVDRYALHVRPHCLMKLVQFYESRSKPTKKG